MIYTTIAILTIIALFATSYLLICIRREEKICAERGQNDNGGDGDSV
jgi:hypothetical protein